MRIFSAYGSGLRKQLLWDIYQKYLNTGRIDLFGTGNETRDFIHISDILRALELILAYQGPEEIFNVANGEEVSIRELAEIYAKQLGENTDIVRFNGETKVGDPQNWRADISLLKKNWLREKNGSYRRNPRICRLGKTAGIERAKKNGRDEKSGSGNFVYLQPAGTYKAHHRGTCSKRTCSRNRSVCIFRCGKKKMQIKEKVQEIRDYVKSVQGFRQVELTAREQNYGLAKKCDRGRDCDRK